MAVKTTYYDSKGEKKTGYIKDGITYTTPDLTTPVEAGSMVETGGGIYYKTPEGGLKISDETKTPHYLEKEREARVAASEAGISIRLDNIRKRARAIEDEKRLSDRNAYNAYLQAINPYGAEAEKRVQMGLNSSGFSETALANLGSTYQLALQGNEKARREALITLVELSDQARKEGDRERYNIMADMYKSLYEAQREKEKQESKTTAATTAATVKKSSGKTTATKKSATKTEETTTEVNSEEQYEKDRAQVMKYLNVDRMGLYNIAKEFGMTEKNLVRTIMIRLKKAKKA